MTQTETAAQPANFQVVRGGPGCWYAMNVRTRQLLPFKTKRAAVAACAERNA